MPFQNLIESNKRPKIKLIPFLVGILNSVFMLSGPGGLGYSGIAVILLLIVTANGKRLSHLNVGNKFYLQIFLSGGFLVVAGLLVSSFIQGNGEAQRVLAICSQYLFVFFFLPIVIFNLKNDEIYSILLGIVIGSIGVGILSILLYTILQDFGRATMWVWTNGRLYLWTGPNGLGPYLVSVIFLINYFSRYYPSSVCYFGILLLIITMILTGSNSAMLIFIFGLIIFALTGIKLNKIIIAFFLLVFLFLGLQIVIDSLAENFRVVKRFIWIFELNLSGAGTFSQRLGVIQNAINHIQNHPFIGLGAGAAGDEVSNFAINHQSGQPHNTFVLLWAEGGALSLIGILVWLCGFVLIAIRSDKTLRPYMFVLIIITSLTMMFRPHYYQVYLLMPLISFSIFSMRMRKDVRSIN